MAQSSDRLLPPPHPGLSPIRAAASSFYAPDGRLPEHAVNGNGLKAGNAHVTSPPGGTMWLSNSGDPAGHFEIDLRGVHNLNDLRIWNYNETSGTTSLASRGVREAAVYVAGNDHVYGATPVAMLNLAAAPGDANVDFSQVTSLAGAQGRYVKIDVLSNHGDPSFAGLSEVKVTGTPTGAMPLPVTIEHVSSNIAVFGRPAEAAINDAGMGVGDTHTINPAGRMWLNQGTFANVPSEQFDTQPEITFDLGSEVAIGNMKVWNYNEVVPTVPSRNDELLGRGVHFAEILVAGEDMVFSSLGLAEFDRAPGNETTDFGQVIDLGGTRARYVKFDILSNHLGRFFDDPFGTDGFQNFAGLSEVEFFAPVPEPATSVLLVMGLAGLCWRRAKAKDS